MTNGLHSEFRQAQSPELLRDTPEKVTFALSNFTVNTGEWKESSA